MPKASRLIDSSTSFEKAFAGRSTERFVLRLYIAGTTPRSVQAVVNIRAICEEALQGRYDLEVIDIYQQPHQAKPEQIVVVPTLVRKLPLPVRKVIGDLSNKDRVLVGLDIITRPMGGDQSKR